MKILIVVPAHNEEKILKDSLLKLFNFCQKNLKVNWQIIVVDNKSTDQTAVIGKNLANQYEAVDYLYVEKQGKGAAIQAGWQKYLADIYCFMDADLATDLSALPALIQGIEEGNDLVIGSRFHAQSQVERSSLRKIISNTYRLVLKTLLNLKVNDAPCGFKAISNKVKTEILPKIKNQEWFFDSELVALAEKQGYKIKEIPVKWSEPRQKGNKSRVKIISLSLAYFKEVLALKKRINKAIKR